MQMLSAWAEKVWRLGLEHLGSSEFYAQIVVVFAGVLFA